MSEPDESCFKKLKTALSKLDKNNFQSGVADAGVINVLMNVYPGKYLQVIIFMGNLKRKIFI